jgi:hypothetical protein
LEALQFPQGLLRVVCQAQHLLGIVLHDLTGVGQKDAFAHALQERDTEFLLQSVHVIADRRLTDMENLPGSAREAAGRGDGMEDLQTVGIHGQG